MRNIDDPGADFAGRHTESSKYVYKQFVMYSRGLGKSWNSFVNLAFPVTGNAFMEHL